MILCISCDGHYVFDEYKTVSTQWDKNQEIQFAYPSQDTINPYNLFINLRNDNSYKFSNLFLIVEMNYPHGKTVTDTLEYKMAEPDGTFLGSGFTDIKENKLWYKGYDKPFIFSEKGDYIINIKHAMRENGQTKGIENLTGILDIGFRVEKLLQ
jgi:gliding motility-associated lipoprotein GldH